MLLAGQVLMIEPKGFSFNHETTDNSFQIQSTPIQAPGEAAMREFHELKKKLISADLEVNIYSPKEGTPDAVFPNNWFSTTPEGKLILYPMMAKNRRLERRDDIINRLKENYSEIIDLTSLENDEKYLEGTGSLVIDHENKIAFAAISQRTHKDAVAEWKKRTGYEVITFGATDKNNQTVYHTNVILTLGEGFAIVCDEAIKDEAERGKLIKRISQNREIISITLNQMHAFCGNCLELKSESGRNYLIMSAQAYSEFTEKQKSVFIKYCTIIYAPLTTIESIGGGSARCMIAELF
jgi:hypothetical protein